MSTRSETAVSSPCLLHVVSTIQQSLGYADTNLVLFPSLSPIDLTPTSVLTVSLEGMYNTTYTYDEDRHISANFNGYRFFKELDRHTVGGAIPLQQITMDYFWIPEGAICEKWNDGFFENTLSRLAHYLVLPQAPGATDQRGFGVGCIYLPCELNEAPGAELANDSCLSSHT